MGLIKAIQNLKLLRTGKNINAGEPYRDTGEHMVYRQGVYTLYTMKVTLKGGRKQDIYFFSKKQPKSGTPCDIPSGYTTGINSRTKLPYLKKK